MGYSSDDTIDYMLISEKPISRKQFQSTMKRSSRFIRESLEKFKRSTPLKPHFFFISRLKLKF